MAGETDAHLGYAKDDPAGCHGRNPGNGHRGKTVITDAAREDLLAAVGLLEQALLPHLRREELEMMPVVARTLAEAELDAIEQELFLRPKSKVQLGDEGQWLIDNASQQSRQRILGVVPAPLRFALVHVFGPRYRRKRRLLWGSGPPAAIPPLPVDSTAVTG